MPLDRLFSRRGGRADLRVAALLATDAPFDQHSAAVNTTITVFTHQRGVDCHLEVMLLLNARITRHAEGTR